MKRPGVY